eukprot:scaffold533_cov369-Prasinococcus_capsulatus_cf.AAC.14
MASWSHLERGRLRIFHEALAHVGHRGMERLAAVRVRLEGATIPAPKTLASSASKHAHTHARHARAPHARTAVAEVA